MSDPPLKDDNTAVELFLLDKRTGMHSEIVLAPDSEQWSCLPLSRVQIDYTHCQNAANVQYSVMGEIELKKCKGQRHGK